MVGGMLFGSLFFLLLLVAAWTSSISLIEPAVTMMVENLSMTRRQAAYWSGFCTWLLGLGTAFSFNIFSEIKVFGMTFFEQIDFLTSNLMLPFGGICIAIFAGWLMNKESSQIELNLQGKFFYKLWQILIRYVAPIAVSIVLLHAIGIF